MVSDQIDTLAALPLGKEPLYSLHRRLGGRQITFWPLWRWDKSKHRLRIEFSNKEFCVLGDFRPPYSPYSPDLAPSDYHLFSKMKVWLATQRSHTNEELMDGVKTWLHNLAAPFYDEGLQKLVPRYDKCLNVDGNYVEK